MSAGSDRRVGPHRTASMIRASCGLAAVAGLHAAALAILPVGAPMRAAASEPAASSPTRVVVLRVATLGTTGTPMKPPPPAVPTVARTVGTPGSVGALPPGFASSSPPGAARSARMGQSPVETVRADGEPGRGATASGGQGGAAAAAPAPADPATMAAERRPVSGDIAFREQWELDEPPQFLHVPVELAELVERLAAPVDARVAVFIDARGTVARIEIDGMIDEDDGDALRRALQAAAFAPGRLTGSAVAAVKRIEMRGLDIGMRVVTASASGVP